MKQKTLVFLMLCFICLAVSGCSGSELKTGSNTNEKNTTGTENIAAAAEEDTLVDLTKLSSTMIYSEVYNMMTTPNKYIGKTIKMKGQFTVYHDDASGNNYFAVVIVDATACCQQGMEFILGNNAVYPNDYPAKESEITVQGVFETYNEGKNQYCHLINAEVIK